ncbi:MAG: hypothetical protein ACYCXA_02050 [Actinomycetes bacterium]
MLHLVCRRGTRGWLLSGIGQQQCGLYNYWWQSDLYDASWAQSGASAYPQTYLPGMSQEWTMIALYGVYHGAGSIAFQGPTDEYSRDISTWSANNAGSSVRGCWLRGKRAADEGVSPFDVAGIRGRGSSRPAGRGYCLGVGRIRTSQHTTHLAAASQTATASSGTASPQPASSGQPALPWWWPKAPTQPNKLAAWQADAAAELQALREHPGPPCVSTPPAG